MYNIIILTILTILNHEFKFDTKYMYIGTLGVSKRMDV